MSAQRWLTSLLLASLSLTACTSGGEDTTSGRAGDGPGEGTTSGPASGGPGESPRGVQVLQLTQPRAVHHATELSDGRVLFTGGCTLPGCEGFDQGKVTEIFDPKTGEFRLGPAMLAPRAGGTATLLLDGRVLLTGGYTGEGRPPTDAAELYDPRTNAFVAAGSMTTPRADQTATLLDDGRVLLAGGVGVDGTALSSTESFDPRTNDFVAGPHLSSPRTGQSAIVLGSSVLLIGGNRAERALGTTDLLQDGVWAPGPDLLTPRLKLGAAALDGRRAFVVGGASTTEGRERLASTEILSLRTNRSRYGPELSEGQYKLDGAVSRLGDGRIAVAGGDQVNIYDPRTDTMTTLEEPTMGSRSFISATLVRSAELLIAGGYDAAITPTDQAWLVSVR